MEYKKFRITVEVDGVLKWGTTHKQSTLVTASDKEVAIVRLEQLIKLMKEEGKDE